MEHWENEASFGDLIISQLFSSRSRRVQRKVLYRLVQEKRRLNNQAFNNNLYRLRDREILNFDPHGDILVNRNNLQRHILFKNIKERPAGDVKIMVLFDIPERKRKIRNWLRLQLKLWGFKMVQQSVWLGKGPLPKEFTERLQLFGVSKCVKILKVQSIKA
jgi:DNA-binding transcriptional regulator PaaX